MIKKYLLSLLFILIIMCNSLATFLIYQFGKPLSIFSQEYGTISLAESYRQIYIIDVKDLPQLIGARADSLLLAVYDGIKWYYDEIWVWNGSRTIWTSYNSTIEIPNAGRYLTNNCRIIIKLPLYIKNLYTAEWPIMAALDGLHNRLYVEIYDQGVNRGFYIFYDKNNSRGIYPFIPPTKYEKILIRSKQLGANNILSIEHRFVYSFLISRDFKEILAYNITYKEFSEKYQVELTDQPWYINSGDESPPLQEEYWFFTPIIKDSLILENEKREYNVYIGTCVYKTTLYIKAYNPLGQFSELIVTIEKLEELSPTNQVIIGTKTHEYSFEPLEERLIEIPIYLEYDDSTYYSLNITFSSPAIEIYDTYIIVIKDYSGIYDTYPTPETKEAIYGYMEEPQFTTNMWIKHNIAFSNDEFSIISTPVINGFYKYADPSRYGIYAKMKYYIEHNTSIDFYLNGVLIYSTDLTTGSILHIWQTKEIWIPLNEFSDIITDAIKSGLGLILTIKTDIFQNVVEHIGFKEIYIKLPFHPDVWRPKSYSFGKHVHIAGLAGAHVYPDNIYSVGQASFIIAINEYSYDPYGDDITSYHIIAEVIASGMNYPEANYNSMVHEVLVNLSVPKYVYGSTLPTRPAESIYLKGQANSELGSYLEIARHAYWIVDAMYNVYGLLSNGWSPILGGVLFVLGKISDILQESLASVGVDIIDNDLYRTYLITWYGGLQPVEYGRFRYIIPIVRSKGITSDGWIKGGVYVWIDAKAYCYIEARVLSGQTLYRSEKYVIEGNKLLVNR